MNDFFLIVRGVAAAAAAALLSSPPPPFSKINQPTGPHAGTQTLAPQSHAKREKHAKCFLCLSLSVPPFLFKIRSFSKYRRALAPLLFLARSPVLARKLPPKRRALEFSVVVCRCLGGEERRELRW